MYDHIPSFVYDAIGEFIAMCKKDAAHDMYAVATSLKPYEYGVSVRIDRFDEVTGYTTCASIYFQTGSLELSDTLTKEVHTYINQRT